MEEFALLAVAGVLIIVLVSLFAPKLGVAAPILLVIVGIGCSLIPGAPRILLEPEWILMIALPPILYSAAVNVPITDFRRDLETISALSVLLVIAWRAGTLAPTGLFAVISREGSLVLNNLLLCTIAAVVLVGTLYPMFADLLMGTKISVGPPFFNTTIAPLAIPLAIAMPEALVAGHRTPDLGGHATTEDMTNAVLAAL